MLRERQYVKRLDDEALVAAFVDRNDEHAFAQLVHRHQRRIYSFLMGMVGDASIANDLFQETFIRVVQAMRNERAGYERQGRWLGWVLRIARNTTLDHLRSRKKWTDVDANRDDQEDSVWDRLPDELPIADASLFTAQQRAVLETCIQALPDEQREVLLLREEGDLTFREIADITNVSINTALGRMRYALINLRKMISADLARELNDFTD